jgi:hypothetical protein
MGVSGEPKQPALEPLSSAGVAGLLEHVQDNPLGNKPSGGKTSLAGVQDKIVLARTGEGWNRVIDGWPSTHILKPASRDYPTSIYDEEFGSRFAQAAGLTSFPTWIEEFAGVPAVVIERYDRSPDAPEGRIHQEDFSQVLGAAGSTVTPPSPWTTSLRRHARGGLPRQPISPRRYSPWFSGWRARRHPTSGPTPGSPVTSPGSPPTCSPDARSGPAVRSRDGSGN